TGRAQDRVVVEGVAGARAVEHVDVRLVLVDAGRVVDDVDVDAAAGRVGEHGGRLVRAGRRPRGGGGGGFGWGAGWGCGSPSRTCGGSSRDESGPGCRPGTGS